MDDHSIIEGEGVTETLLAGLENEDQKIWFQHFESAQRPLTLSDLEIDAGTPTSSSGSRSSKFGIIALCVLALVSALAGAFPGPAAGIIPLAMDVLANVGPLVAALMVGLVILLALRQRDTSMATPASSFATRRPIFVGSGPMTVQIGEIGIQLKFPNRFWRAHWVGFDAAALMSTDLNGGDLPIISKQQAGDTTLETLFVPDQSEPAIAALIEQAANWASTNDTLRLPVKVAKDFATKPGKDGAEALAPLGGQREFIVIHKRFFEAPDESSLTWARFVAAVVFMVQLKDPEWIEAIADED